MMKRWVQAAAIIALALCFGKAAHAQGGVLLSWKAPASGSAPTSYNILRTVVQGGENGVPIAVVSAPDANSPVPTTYIDSTGVAGGTYWYEVVSVNAHGLSMPSNEVSWMFPLPIVAPESPTNLTAMPAP